MFKLTKKIINCELISHLSVGQRGPKCKVSLWRIVRAIFKRLKTGCQWRELPMRDLFGQHRISWQTVFYYYSKWCKDGSWYKLFTALLNYNRQLLNMSSVALDGSHTLVKRGGSEVSYQGRKSGKTANILLLTDKQGIPLGCSEIISGQHNDLFEIEKNVSKILDTLIDAKISYKGLFLNADAGFDSFCLRNLLNQYEIHANIDNNKRSKKEDTEYGYLVDEELYRERFVIERTHAWLDGFKNLLIRYETNAKHWLGLHYFAFAIIILRKKYQLR